MPEPWKVVVEQRISAKDSALKDETRRRESLKKTYDRLAWVWIIAVVGLLIWLNSWVFSLDTRASLFPLTIITGLVDGVIGIVATIVAVLRVSEHFSNG